MELSIMHCIKVRVVRLQYKRCFYFFIIRMCFLLLSGKRGDAQSYHICGIVEALL